MKHASFDLIGISIRTTNENGQSGIDIPELWKRFFAEGILDKIPHKLDPSILCVYTDYEKDFTKPYTVILGCRVNNLKDIPAGMIGRTIPGGDFEKFTAKGDIHGGSVFSEWVKIWNSPLNRKYTADFEIYGEKALDPKNAEVDIFIAV
jgi:predicted transcriptional regulator YdeE